ncbi:MAG: response regulator transcription factor [Hydrococcus sp. SU_1_0]|nr:response regulator transcription factor [Hydrococcus sp. SU_1_0]NJO96721.1 response regulator transcription factor [Pleurocapsa sp. CRU_1_2]
MSKTIALVSNNIFYGLGLQKYVLDYKLQSIPFQQLEDENLDQLLKGIDLVLVSSELASPEKTTDLIKSILENQTQVIYLAQARNLKMASGSQGLSVTQDRDTLIPQLYSIGCQGIVEQQRVEEQLSIAIKAVKSGGTYYSQGLFDNSQMILLGPLLELFKELDSTKQKLTPKEREIAEFYTEGLSLTDIMKELEISKSTINTHMESIRSKFQVSSNREIITKYQIGRLKSIGA